MSSTSVDNASNPSLPDLLKTAFEACDGAKTILARHYGNLRNVSEKFHAGLVSDADRESEKFIVETILSRYPHHAILGEESGLNGTPDQEGAGGAFWMIDPLDGTTNFIHQFPYFNISIGLELHGELVLGVVDAPKLGLRYYATKGGGAYLIQTLDGVVQAPVKLQVSPRTKFSEGLFATGFSTTDDRMDAQLNVVEQCVREGRGLRRAGAAALDLCFVAQGAFDVFWEKGLSPWDLAAGVTIAREAGAAVTDLNGGVFPPRGTSVICGSPALQTEILRRFKKLL